MESYDVSFTAGAGLETVTGSILLDGSQVSSYSLSGSGAQSFSYSGFQTFCSASCGLAQSGDALYFNPNPGDGISFGLNVGLGGVGGRDGDPVLQTNGYSYFIPQDLQIGTLAAPEISPAGAVASLTLLVGLCLVGCARRAPRRPSPGGHTAHG